ncbi:hypothetical protein [Photobacterium leiognathi]|uniref:hypothetical protein n=1 Tax=Photobacterium leiognathi TaxID=553611 RepID=UPI000D155124|nr:hypothetical protein [Photobacterium leiognathi]PSW53041.1 hypothetical protein C0W50_19730 [Photobacterium leiognathi subsp. mandapamensis]
MSELTAKQRYQREYYQRNKERICKKMRDEYQPKPRQPRKKAVKAVNSNSPAKQAPKPIRVSVKPPRCDTPKARTLALTPRHKIEDILLAKQLGIEVSELQ